MSADGPRTFRGAFRTDAEARAIYSESAGIQRILPRAIAVPVDGEDLLNLLEWARSEGAALIARGSGSSMAGGAIGPGVIVDLSRWKKIDDSRIGDRRLVVQPGAICAEVQAVARARGLRFPVSPSSAAFCTIGGMTATNAAGAHSLAYGAMREWVEAIDWVSAAGITQRSEAPAQRRASPHGAAGSGGNGGVRKNSSGYFTGASDLDLLVGSEGTLGIFTSVELRLTDEPRSAESVMGVFSSLESATEAAIGARAAGAAACELLDRTFLEFVAASSGHRFDASTEAILLADVEGSDAAEAHGKANAITRAFLVAGAIDARRAETTEERERLWELRHAASPMLSRLSAELKSMQFIEDGCVPPPRLGKYVAGVRAALDRQKVRGVIFGHAGDAHVHVNPLVNVSDPDWRARVEGLLDEVTALVASLGGTLSGEHGDGRLRTPLLGRVMKDEEIAELAAVKAKYDPHGLLNPGVKTGKEKGLGDIKYDPLLQEHPPRAKEGLKEVERERGYGRFRLDMIDG